MPIFPPIRRPTVDLVVFGDEPTHMVPIARRTLRERFGVEPGVRRVEPTDQHADRAPLPDAAGPTYYPADELLEPTAAASEAEREIGLVADPLVLEETPGIFGVAIVGETTALVTSAPLSGDDDRFDTRVEKQVTKQFGRLFGLEETHEGCVLAETSTVFGLDETPTTFCESCRARLTDPSTSPQPPHWFVRDTRVYGAVADEGEGSDDPTGGGTGAPVDDDPDRRTNERAGDHVTAGSDPENPPSAASRSATDGPRVPTAVRRSVHGVYRYVRVWALVLGFAILGILSFVAELELYARVIGSDPSVAVVWGMLVVAVAVGYYGHLTVRRWAGRGRTLLARLLRS